MQDIPIDPQMPDTIINEWQKAVEAVFWPSSDGARSAFYAQFPNIRVAMNTPNSLNSAVAASVTNSYGLVAVAVLAIAIFVIGVLFIRGRVFVRTLLGIVGLVSVALAISAGFGFCLICGLPFTTVTQVLPFILLGVGAQPFLCITLFLCESILYPFLTNSIPIFGRERNLSRPCHSAGL